MIEQASLVVVLFLGAYFVILGAAFIFLPQPAIRFLGQFAQSPTKHYIEAFARILVGFSLVIYSPHMFGSAVFNIFGWVLVVTSAALLLVPWRIHQKFANHVVPRVSKYISVVGLVSLASGVFVFIGVARGHTA